MEDKEYFQQMNTIFRRVEDKLDEYEEDLDYDKADGKLEIIFENGNPKVVLNTQRAIHEIWLAGNAQAWHFRFEEEKQRWFAQAEQVEFYSCLSQLLSNNLGQTIVFR